MAMKSQNFTFGAHFRLVDSHGNILFADRLHQRIRRVGPGGIIQTVIGNGKQGSEGDGGLASGAALHLPEVITIDLEDNIYITQRSGNGWIVRKVNAEGIITHFAGNGMQGNTGDGGSAINISDNIPSLSATVSNKFALEMLCCRSNISWIVRRLF